MLDFGSDTIFRTLMDGLSEGVYFVDPDRKILYWNRAAEELTGFTAQEVIGQCCADEILVHVSEEGVLLCKDGCPLAATIVDGDSRRASVYLRHKEGHRLPVTIAASVVRDEHGHVIGALETFQKTPASMVALDELDRLKSTTMLCPLTGVGNRSYLEEMLATKIETARRRNTSLSLLMFDVDQLQAFNAKLGHKVGDVILKMVARTLAGAMRTRDRFGRWDGATFIALLPDLKRLDVEDTANRLRQLVQHSAHTTSKGMLRVTVSAGAYVIQPGDTPEKAVGSAERLMRTSKRAGRNRVTLG